MKERTEKGGPQAGSQTILEREVNDRKKNQFEAPLYMSSSNCSKAQTEWILLLALLFVRETKGLWNIQKITEQGCPCSNGMGFTLAGSWA